MMKVTPVWADSLGAKSFCTLVETPDLALMIDPGASILQKGFPAPDAVKEERLRDAWKAITAAAGRATHVAVTHYHHDHYRQERSLYAGKHLYIKSPNAYVNRSQWHRSREFMRWYAASFGGALRESPPGEDTFPDPLQALPLSAVHTGGDTEKRRQQYRRHARRWTTEPWVLPPDEKVVFCDGRTFGIGNTDLRFSAPLFHGIEYASPGFVVALAIEHAARKTVYTSDLMGPLLEDYAAWLIDEAPDCILLDGPPTYLLGHLLSRENFDRCIANLRRIARECPGATILLDHHVTRDTRFRERMEGIYDLAGVTTVAGYLGEEVFADRFAHPGGEE
ncbi:MBL fold metallo-hydrolase [Methanoculleus taiwanensis]|uniref:MBL fold metallo-hydrolase n=1 Tax=Methanoculleus taiwanensis TaxID=1550565 RepID=UPI000FFEB087|nr:MBL fold metallo-hydrolase [Methanoculleus taiwanensis]